MVVLFVSDDLRILRRLCVELSFPQGGFPGGAVSRGILGCMHG